MNENYWRSIAKAYREVTGLCLTKTAAIAITKKLNAQLETGVGPPKERESEPVPEY